MIIESLLDTDLYKFTMMQVVLHQFPGANATYKFKCRSQGVDLRSFADEIKAEIAHYCQLRLTNDELSYLRQLAFIKPDFVDFLSLYQAKAEFVEISCEPELAITIKGPWLHTILFEIPILAIISEVYCRHQAADSAMADGQQRLADKITLIKNSSSKDKFRFSDFGTRRRFSRQWQEACVSQVAEQLPEQFVGTSNVWLAKKYQLRPIGTMAHEYIQACQALGPRLIYSQRFAFERWAQEYRGDLGIALSDTYSLNAFLNDFDLYFCKLFDGARHDSGDPFIWGDKVIEHYQKHRVDPRNKQLIFSDALEFKKALALAEYFHDRAQVAFGIGTHLTNDVGVKPLDIVIKLTRCNDQPVAKISDTASKTMCEDESYLTYLKQVFQI